MRLTYKQYWDPVQGEVPRLRDTRVIYRESPISNTVQVAKLT